jgi:protein-tyrosine phosphatase
MYKITNNYIFFPQFGSKIYFGPSYSSIDEAENMFSSFKELNIKYIWNLEEFTSSYNLEKKYFDVIHTPIRDFSIPDDINKYIEDLKSILEIIKNNNIYIHCFGGHGRTGMSLALILILINNISTEEALEKTKELCSGPEVEEQKFFVRDVISIIKKNYNI